MLISGVGYSMGSSVTLRAGAHSVSPVLTAESFGIAPMSPATIALTSSCFLPHIVTVLPMRSTLPVRMLTSWVSVVILPEITFT